MNNQNSEILEPQIHDRESYCDTCQRRTMHGMALHAILTHHVVIKKVCYTCHARKQKKDGNEVYQWTQQMIVIPDWKSIHANYD